MQEAVFGFAKQTKEVWQFPFGLKVKVLGILLGETQHVGQHPSLKGAVFLIFIVEALNDENVGDSALYVWPQSRTELFFSFRFSHVLIKRDNVNVHRAAAKIIVSKSRAARGSVCNVLLSGDSPSGPPWEVLEVTTFDRSLAFIHQS